MKISILTPDFSHNCFGRAWLLAKVLQKNYDIEVIGPAFGDGIWKPLSNLCDFEIKMVKGHANGQFEFKKMLNTISGDVIYASKPLMASFGVGLVNKFGARKPLVLDIDDWELGFGKEFYDSLMWLKKINDFRLSKSNWQSYYYAVIFNKLIWLANAVTVSGKILQAKYGGTIIWHGRDVNTFDPQKVDKIKNKIKYFSDGPKNASIIGFIGTPRPHKGIEDLIEAMELLQNENLLLMIVGVDDGDYCKKLRERIEDSSLKDRVIFFPEQPFNKLPEFLAITDLALIPQRDSPASHGQVPAKIFDAMAMAKPIIATNIGDIPEVLNGCAWITESENPKQLAKTIKYVLDHPVEALEMGLKAREKCKRKYSWYIMENSLMKLFEKYKTN